MDTQSFESLISLLQQEHAIYCEMAELLAGEREAMLAMAAARVTELTARKQTLVLRIKALDESRKLLARRLGAQCGLDPDGVTLTTLCEFADAPHALRLRTVGEALRQAVLHCQELNRFNERAARRGLELVSGVIQQLIDQADPAGRLYQPPAGGGGYPRPRRSGAGGQSGYLSHEA